MGYSLDWEAVTPPSTTFVGFDLVVWEAWVGVRVLSGTYYGSHSSSKPMTIRFDRAPNIECPLE